MNSRIAFVFFLAMVMGSFAANEGKKCKPGDYHCGDDRCIPHSFVCDGVFDCGDGRDEKNCKSENPKASSINVAFDSPVAHSPVAHAPLADAPMADMPFGDEADAPVFPLEFGR